jgi:TctA family transporter
MDSLVSVLPNLAIGLHTAVSPMNLFYCFVGVFIGTLIGVLPGIGPIAAIAMLMPATYVLDPVGGVIMLSGIFYGAQYGGSTTAILVKLPGESSSVMTCIDGHEMAKKGRAGPALAIAAIGSFIAGCFGTALLAVAGPPLADFALKFGAAEYFSMMTMALIIAAALGTGSILKSIGMIFVGLLLGIAGTDVNSGMSRFTFGMAGLADGLSIAVVAMGAFGLTEIFSNLERGADNSSRELLAGKITHLYPTRQDMKDSIGPILRGTVIGTIFGILPGTGGVISTFSSYALEKKLHKHPERFGTGEIQGVAGPEAANNASAQGSFVPMLTLGIPGSGTMALVLGALMIQGIVPGPQMMTQRPDLFWGLIISMFIGNAMLVVLNLPMIGIWVQLLKIPYRLLFPAILTFMAIGVYSINNLNLDLFLMVGFGLAGYVFQKLRIQVAPLVLAFVLGPLIEESLRRAMVLSRGDPTIFITRPLSAMFLVITAAMLLVMLWPSIRRKREEVIVEDEAGA